MKILLINPYGEIEYQNYASSKFPSLQLGIVSSILKKKGCQIKYLDLTSLDMEFEELLKSEEFNHVLISNQRFYTYFAYMYPAITKTCKLIKRVIPDVVVTVADSQLQLYPTMYTKLSEVDHFLGGEIEATYPDLIDRYLDNQHPDKLIQGPLIADLNTLATPDFEIMLGSLNKGTPGRKFTTEVKGQIVASRGCTFNCEYCLASMLNKGRVRYRSIENIIGEIKEWMQHGVSHFIFWDETFTMHREQTIRLLEEMRKLEITWSCNTRIDFVDPELLQLMAQSGCRSILFGIERFLSERVEKLASTKKFELETYYEKMRLMDKLGIETVASLIFGLEDDLVEYFASEINLIKQLAPSFAYCRIAIPLPGTPLYERLVQDHKIPPVEEWNVKIKYIDKPNGFPTISEYIKRKELQNEVEKINEALNYS